MCLYIGEAQESEAVEQMSAQQISDDTDGDPSAWLPEVCQHDTSCSHCQVLLCRQQTSIWALPAYPVVPGPDRQH